jgi:hypothetical protein
MADELEQTFGSPGFKILMRQYWNEVRRAEMDVLDAGRREGNPSKVAMDLRHKQGFLEGVMALEPFFQDLLVCLKAGKTPDGWK